MLAIMCLHVIKVELIVATKIVLDENHEIKETFYEKNMETFLFLILYVLRFFLISAKYDIKYLIYKLLRHLYKKNH